MIEASLEHLSLRGFKPFPQDTNNPPSYLVYQKNGISIRAEHMYEETYLIMEVTDSKGLHYDAADLTNFEEFDRIKSTSKLIDFLLSESFEAVRKKKLRQKTNKPTLRDVIEEARYSYQEV